MRAVVASDTAGVLARQGVRRQSGCESLGEIRLEDEDPLVENLAAALLTRAVRTRCLPGTAPGFSQEPLERMRFVGVHGLLSVPTCPLRRTCADDGGSSAPTTVLYVLRDAVTAELHRVHGCADAYVVLVPEDGGRFDALPWPSRLEAAGLTPREADVMALLLARRTNEEMASSLVLSPATVRAHCRAVLRKVGTSDRRRLWALYPSPVQW